MKIQQGNFMLSTKKKKQSLIILQSQHFLLCILGLCFYNFSVPMNHLEMLLKRRFWSRRSELDSLHFEQVLR